MDSRDGASAATSRLSLAVGKGHAHRRTGKLEAHAVLIPLLAPIDRIAASAPVAIPASDGPSCATRLPRDERAAAG